MIILMLTLTVAVLMITMTMPAIITTDAEDGDDGEDGLWQQAMREYNGDEDDYGDGDYW